MVKPPKCLKLQGFQANETHGNGDHPDGEQEPYSLAALRARHFGPASPADRGCQPDRQTRTSSTRVLPFVSVRRSMLKPLVAPPNWLVRQACRTCQND